MPVKKLVVKLPFPLPTWNALFAMHPWKRKKVRDWIHSAIDACELEFIPGVTDSAILTVSREKLFLMGLSVEAFLKMIRPSSSNKSPSHRKKASSKKP